MSNQCTFINIFSFVFNAYNLFTLIIKYLNYEDKKEKDNNNNNKKSNNDTYTCLILVLLRIKHMKIVYIL